MKTHRYAITVEWTGNTGSGTAAYRSYERRHEISAAGKPQIQGSSDPAFRGDAARWNPEDLLVASLSACHQLWYLHLCADAGIVVIAYIDRAEGTMLESPESVDRIESVTLRPAVTIAAGSAAARARELHAEAARRCVIANAVKFPVRHEPEITVAP